MKKIYDFAIDLTLDVISGKWKPAILCHLGEHKTLRTGELRRMLPGISQRVLTKQLRELEDDGVVSRQVFGEVPPRVEYSLTEEGRSLREILISMSDWGNRHAKMEKQAGQEIEIHNGSKAGFEKM